MTILKFARFFIKIQFSQYTPNLYFLPGPPFVPRPSLRACLPRTTAGILALLSLRNNQAKEDKNTVDYHSALHCFGLECFKKILFLKSAIFSKEVDSRAIVALFFEHE